MRLVNSGKTFIRDEDGAVTVDWVVLTAAIVGLGLLVIATVQSGTEEAGTTLSNAMGDLETGTD